MDKKIFYLIDKLSGKGGAATHLLELIPGLKNDFSIYVCALCGTNEGPSFDKLKELGVPVYFLGVNKIYNIDALKKLIRLINLLKEIKPDIIHTYLFSSNIFGIIAGYFARVPIKITSMREVGAWKKKQHIIAERFISHYCNLIIVPSEAIKEYAITKEKIKKDKFLVIHNGVNASRFLDKRADNSLKQKLGIIDTDLVIVTIANLIPVKGHNVLFEAAKRITDESPNVKFIIIGGGPLLEEFQDKVKSANKIGRINYLGYRTDAEAIMALLDIYVCASLMEGFSNAIIEAMATGKPVIATSVGGNVESVLDSKTGFLVKPADASDMYTKTTLLINDVHLRERMGQEGRERYLKYFTSEIMINKFKQLYVDLLSSPIAKSAKNGRQ